MLNLGDDAIAAWTRSTAVEHGGLAQPETTGAVSSEVVARAFSRLADLLNTQATATPGELATKLRDPSCLDDMRAMLDQAGTARALRVIDWLARDLPGGLAVAVDLFEQSTCGTGSALAESERHALLDRIYAPERLRLLEEACRSTALAKEAA